MVDEIEPAAEPEGVIASEPGITSAPKEAKPAEQPAADLDEELGKVYDKINKPRAEDGKFKSSEDGDEAPAKKVEPKQPPAKADDKTPDQPDAEAKEPVKPAIPKPQSWSRDAEKVWAEIPPEAQELIAQREKDAHTKITELGNKAKASEDVQKAIDQYKHLFEKNNVPPAAGITALLDAQAMLDNPQTRVAALAKIAESYGIRLDQLAQARPDTNALQMQAQMQAMAREIHELRSQRQAEAQELQSRVQSSIIQDIQSFAKANPEWSQVEDIVVPFVQSAREQNPSASNHEVLKAAMDAAVWTKADLREKRIAQEAAKKAEEAAKKAAAAAQAAGINVRSSGTARPSPKALDDALSSVWDRLNGG